MIRRSIALAAALYGGVPLAAQPAETAPPHLATPAPALMPTGKGPHGKNLYYFMVLSNATAGQDEEFNRWYDRIHAPVMIESGDFVWAQRFMLSPTQGGGGGTKELQTRRYLVIFAYETDDPEKVLADANRRLALPRNVASRALDYSTLQSVTWMAISPVITQQDAKRLLAEEEAAGRVPKPGEPEAPGAYHPFSGMRPPNAPAGAARSGSTPPE